MGNKNIKDPRTRVSQIHIDYCDFQSNIIIVMRNEKGIQKIKMKCKEIEKIPQNVAHFENIIELYFDSCNIQRFPIWVNKLINLEILCLAACSLTFLPESIKDLQKQIDDVTQ